MAQYVRVKKGKTTYFFECNPDDFVNSIKQKLTQFNKQEQSEMRLYLDDNLLDDKATIHDSNIQNSAELRLTLKKQTGEWEELHPGQDNKTFQMI